MKINFSLKSVFDEFLAKASPEPRARDENGERQNDTDATIDLDSESEDEHNVQIEKEKDERSELDIENSTASKNNVQVDNPESTIPNNNTQRIAEMEQLMIVIDRNEVPSQLNNMRIRRRKQTKRKKQPDIKYSCEICQKKFNCTPDLISHRKNHLKQFPIHCKICLQFFTNSNEKVVHENVCTKLRFECYVCKLTVRRRCDLTEHMRTHSGTPLKCKHCVKRYRYKRNLNKHIQYSH